MSRGSSLTMARTPRWDTNQLRILLGVVNGCYFQEAHWTSRPSGPQSNFTQYIHGTWQWPPPCAMAKQNDRPRAKGAVGCPPCEKTVIFRRVGMSEQWRLAVSVGGFWLCSGRLDPWRLDQKKQKKIRPVWAGFSVGDITPVFRKCPLLGCIHKGRRGFVLYVKQGPQVHSIFC